MPSGQIELINSQKYIDAFDMLDEMLKSAEWEAVQKVWKLLHPDVWANYEMFGFSDMEEQRLLNSALADLKIYWRQNKTRGFYGKHIDEESTYEESGAEVSEEGGVLAEGAGVSEANC